MECNRMFLIGFILIFLGLQLRFVKTYEFNEKASHFVQTRLKKTSSYSPTMPVGYGGGTFNDPWSSSSYFPGTSRFTITPPRWVGWSLLSVGAILVFICPCFKK